jgi:histidyl-tRNA synthetase
MSNKPTLAKGTRDFGPAQVAKRKFILNTIEAVFKKYGFMPIETPAMENLTTLEGKYGDEGDQLLFRIINSGDYLKDLKALHERVLADESQDKTYLPSINGKLNELDSKATLPFITEKGLRYDLTVPFARYVVMNRNDITFPFKRYQMQPVWRADRPQKGRYREFWQCDADIVGSDSLLCELDLIQIYIEAFTLLKIPFQIKYNNRKLLDGLSHLLDLADKLMEMTIILDKQDKIGIDAVVNELLNIGANPSELKSFTDALNNPIDTDNVINFFSRNETSLKGIEELKTISNDLNICFKDDEAINKKVVHDLALARGLSYYTGAIFEVVSTQGSLKSSIGGGGRYDNLTGIFGMPNISGVGISFGLDRIYDVMEELQLFPETLQGTTTRILICAMDQPTQSYCISILKQLRDAGIAAELYPDLKKLGKQLDYANALNIPFAIIVGENEIKSGSLVLKNLSEGTQQELSIQQIITHVGI